MQRPTVTSASNRKTTTTTVNSTGVAQPRPTTTTATTSTSPHHRSSSRTSTIFSTRRLVQFLLVVPPMALLIGVFVFHHHLNTTFTTTMAANHPQATVSLASLARVRKEFHQRYGGKEEATKLYQRGIEVYGDSLEQTAKRLLLLQQQQQGLSKSKSSFFSNKDTPTTIFPMSFGGYSVTVGRGNYFTQSYPFVMERILQPLFRQILGIQLVVRNAAIGGIPSFPYGFCLQHFMGPDAEVISWDYSMNEGASRGGSEVLEAYLRHGLSLGRSSAVGTTTGSSKQQQQQHRSSRRPMFILLDNNKARRQLLREYQESGILLEGIALLGKGSELASPKLLELSEEQRPLGYQDWQEFGSPPSCPGRGNWHPKKMEHEMMGWLLAMYFVDALELVVKDKNNNNKLLLLLSSSSTTTAADKRRTTTKADDEGDGVYFPPPKSNSLATQNDESVMELLYGHVVPTKKDKDMKKNGASSSDYYQLENISCRTNFLPAVDHENILPNIVVSGLIQTEETMDIMKDRSDELYNQGWVLDVSKVERDTKRKVERCGGLGYVDMKIALYGIPESGPLVLWLPYEGSSSSSIGNDDNNVMASTWFDDLVLCEANEKRGDDACKLDLDVKYTVGGIDVIQPTPISGAGEYLKRKTCINVGIPAMAKITKWSELLNQTTTSNNDEHEQQQHNNNKYKPNDFGIQVIIQARRGVTRKNGACCISHVVWEQH